jgi:hypothetical protein
MDVSAGYQQLKRLEEEVPRLSRQARTALAAACATRTLPILSNCFADSTQQFRQALELCWQAAGGAPVDVDLNKKILKECNLLLDQLYEDDDTGAPVCALNAVMYALRSTYEPQAKNASDAALQAHAAARGDASDDEDSDAHLVEEANWQMKALDLISKMPPPYAKTWFREIDIEPKWLVDYQEEWGD